MSHPTVDSTEEVTLPRHRAMEAVTPGDVIAGAPWLLIHGDCLDPVAGLAQLGDAIVDHVITDPPYSEHTHAKQRAGASVQRLQPEGQKRRKISVERDLGFEAITEADAHAVSACARRCARRWFVAFSDMESMGLWMRAVRAAGMEHVRAGAWLKRDAQPQFTGDRPGSGFEPIEIAHPPGRKRWNGGGKHGVWTFGIAKHDRLHSTQKPAALMEALVRDFTDPGDIVVDPFAGSGTTGVACIRLGRRFIGWEREAEFYEAARRRLEQTHEQPDLVALETFRRAAKGKRKQTALNLDAVKP